MNDPVFHVFPLYVHLLTKTVVFKYYLQKINREFVNFESSDTLYDESSRTRRASFVRGRVDAGRDRYGRGGNAKNP